MKAALLGAASLTAVLVFPSAAMGQTATSGVHFKNGPSAGFAQERPFSDARFACAGRDGRDGGHHRDGRRDSFGGCGFFGAGWGYYDPDINRSWDSDSFNSWWHDRPDRAYPRWVQEQRSHETCDPDRMWWSGTGWHC